MIQLAINTIRTLWIDAVQQANSGGTPARRLRSHVVSMPSRNIFDQQMQEYQDNILPPHVMARVAVGQASTFGWERYVDRSGHIIGMNTFGASAPLNGLHRKFGFEPDRVVTAATELLGSA